MSTESLRQPTFRITGDADTSETLIAGFSTFGLAGLTAVDYLVDHLGMEQSGYITADELPAITPFENGTPRHHTRLYSEPDLEFTVLVNELFVPVWAADPLSKAILDWTDANGIEEIAIAAGIPVAHGPDDHRTFYVATEDYRDHRLGDVDIPAMGQGFLDGVNASLVARGMTTSLRTGVFVTPVHVQAPDVEAAIRLLEAIERVYGVEIDTGDLEAFAAEIQQYYRELAGRLEGADKEGLPEDRMYM